MFMPMDPLDYLTDEELLQFFRSKRTEMSVLNPPYTFLNQLRDDKIIPEDRYKTVIKIKSKGQREMGVYELLDWLQTERPQNIKLFWRCVFKDHLLQQYPTLRLFRNSLLDGSSKYYNLPVKVVEPEAEVVEPEVEVVETKVEVVETKVMVEAEKYKRKAPEEGEEGEKTGRKKKQKKMCGCIECELPGPSSRCTQIQKPTDTSSLKPERKKQKKQKKDKPKPRYYQQGFTYKEGIWNLPEYKTHLPVTCGTLKSTLNRDKMAIGYPCILFNGQWVTPPVFVKQGTLNIYGNWKESVFCQDIPLGKLLKKGYLTCPGFQRRMSVHSGQISSVFPYNTLEKSLPVPEEKEKEKEEEDDILCVRVEKSNYTVICGSLTGTLHNYRFASGTRGKSIRTESSWMTPAEFMNVGMAGSGGSWIKDIQWEGKPLSFLIKKGVLTQHQVQCQCMLCSQDTGYQQEQNNDDKCFTCRAWGNLVLCEQCPRSFHQACHLPHVDDTILGVESPWLCTFCILKATQKWLYPSENNLQAAMSCPVTDHLLKCHYLLLFIYNADKDQIFANDPCCLLSRYKNVIKTPMWLDRIAEKLQNNLYQTLEPFLSDFRLIFDNCVNFNKDNAEIRNIGARMKDLFQREFMTIFNIKF